MGLRRENVVSSIRWPLCEAKSVMLALPFLGEDLCAADALSRGYLDLNELALSKGTCNRTFGILGKPLIDLFATLQNAKHQVF